MASDHDLWDLFERLGAKVKMVSVQLRRYNTILPNVKTVIEFQSTSSLIKSVLQRKAGEDGARCVSHFRGCYQGQERMQQQRIRRPYDHRRNFQKVALVW